MNLVVAEFIKAINTLPSESPYEITPKSVPLKCVGEGDMGEYSQKGRAQSILGLRPTKVGRCGLRAGRATAPMTTTTLPDVTLRLCTLISIRIRR